MQDVKIKITPVFAVLVVAWALPWSGALLALPFGENRFEIEPSLNITEGRNYSDSDVQPANEIVGAKLRIKKGSSVNIYFDGYAQRITEQDMDREIKTTDYTVNQFSISQRMWQSVKVTLGRQRVLWGHGFSYVATDFINPPLDPSRLDLANAKGVDSLSFDYFSSGNSITSLVKMSSEAYREGYGFKWTNNSIEGLDFNLIYYNSEETGNALGISFSTDPVRWFKDDSKGALNATLSLGIKEKSEYFQIESSEINPTGVPLSCTHLTGDHKDDRKSFASAMFGLSYEFMQSGVSIRSETYYLQEGYRAEELQRLYNSVGNECGLFTDVRTDLANLILGRIQQHYSTVFIGQDPVTEASGNRFTDRLSYSVGYTVGHEDYSGLTSIAIRSSYFNSAEISLDILIPSSDPTTEFGAIRVDKQITLGLRLVL